MNDFKSAFGSEELAVMTKSILALALKGLIRAEPVMNGLESPGVNSVVILYVFDVVLFCLFKVDSDDLPVKLALVQETQ